MDDSSQEKIPIAPAALSANIGFTSPPQEQPPAYSSLLSSTQTMEPVQPVHTTQPMHTTNMVYMVGQPQIGPNPTTMTCPHCQATITTVIEQEASAKTHLFFLLLCLIGCWCCAPMVYCADECLAKKHTCPNCNQFLGVYDG